MVRANRAKAIMLAGEIAQVIGGALAESKIIGVAGASMTVDNVARFREFAVQCVQLMSVNLPDFVHQSAGQFLNTLRA